MQTDYIKTNEMNGGKVVYDLPLSSIYFNDGMVQKCFIVKKLKTVHLYAELQMEDVNISFQPSNNEIKGIPSIPAYEMELYYLKVKQYCFDVFAGEVEFLAGANKSDALEARNLITRHKVALAHLESVLTDANYPRCNAIDEKARTAVAYEARHQDLVPRDMPLKKYISIKKLVPAE